MNPSRLSAPAEVDTLLQDDQDSLRKLLVEAATNVMDMSRLAVDVPEPLRKLSIGHIVKCSFERIVTKFKSVRNLLATDNIMREADVRLIVFSETVSALTLVQDRYSLKLAISDNFVQENPVSLEESKSLLPQNSGTTQTAEGPRYMTKRRATNFAAVD